MLWSNANRMLHGHKYRATVNDDKLPSLAAAQPLQMLLVLCSIHRILNPD